MRGMGILCIVFHNFLHYVLPVKENEFSFNIATTNLMMSNASTQTEWLLADMLSYWGWYGVVAFVFISGFGLARKYESQGADVRLKRFVKSHWLKTFRLMIIPLTLFAIIWSLIEGRLFIIERYMFEALLLGNIVYPTTVLPGIYWFFGLIFELYLCYRLLIYGRSAVLVSVINALCLAAMVYAQVVGDITLLEGLRHNCIGWLLPFTLGVVAARHNLDALFDRPLKQWLWIVAGSGYLLLSAYNFYLWLLSPVVAIGISISLAAMVPNEGLTQRIILSAGALSPFIFAMHPLVREVLLIPSIEAIFIDGNTPYSVGLIPYTLLFVALSLLSARIYSYIHRRLFGDR